jgi:hypothetical protein
VSFSSVVRIDMGRLDVMCRRRPLRSLLIGQTEERPSTWPAVSSSASAGIPTLEQLAGRERTSPTGHRSDAIAAGHLSHDQDAVAIGVLHAVEPHGGRRLEGA